MPLQKRLFRSMSDRKAYSFVQARGINKTPLFTRLRFQGRKAESKQRLKSHPNARPALPVILFAVY